MALFSEMYHASLRPIRPDEPLPDETKFKYPEPRQQPQSYWPSFVPLGNAYYYTPAEQPAPLQLPALLPHLFPAVYLPSDMNDPINIQAPANTENETPETNAQGVYLVVLILFLALILFVVVVTFAWTVAVAQWSELYHASLRPISPDKPLPDESGFMDAPSTPRSHLPYRILCTDRARPLRPSDFDDTGNSDSGSSQRESSSEDTSTDISSSSSSETTVALSPYIWVTILTLASLSCVLSFLLVAVVSERRNRGLTATPDEAALFVDPIHFMAREDPDVVTAGFEETTGDAASTVRPEVVVGGQAEANPENELLA